MWNERLAWYMKAIPDGTFLLERPDLAAKTCRIVDRWYRLVGNRSMVPPKPLWFIGAGDFDEIGEEFKRHFITLGGLQPGHDVLEIGSGIGRMAIPLTGYLRPPGSYAGFDIVPVGPQWCSLRVTRRHPHFRFFHADVYNKHYNKTGQVPPEGYRFPFDDATFDFVFATSVFTHMLPDSVVHYMSETARVLKPGGTFFGTFFLHTAQTDALESQGRSHAQFPYRPDAPFRAANPHVPEHAVAYAEAYALDLVGRALNDAAPEVHPGAWSGRSDFVSYQDIVIARKDRSTEG